MDHDMLDRELRELLARSISDRPAGAPDHDPLELIEGRVDRRRKRRRVTSAGALAGVAAIVAAIVIVVGQSGGGRHTDVQVTPVTTAPRADRQPERPAVDQYPAWPLAARGDSATVAIGDDIVVWGGDLEAFNMGLPGPDRVDTDGAAFSTTSRTWRKLARSPLPVSQLTPVGVATENGVVVARGKSVAEWDPATNTWRALDDARADVTDLTYTGVVGREVVSYSADQALDLRSGRWENLPAPPDRLERAISVWTGSEVVVLGGSGTPFTSASAIAFDPRAGTWRRRAAPPTVLHAEALGADWDGHRIVVVNYDGLAYSYDPTTDRWSALPLVPARFYEWTPTVRSSAGYTAVFMAQAIVVLTPDDRWVPVPYGVVPHGFGVTTSPEAGAASVDGMVYVWGLRAKADSLVGIDLEKIVDPPARVQVGVASFRAPSGYELARTSYSAAAVALSETVSARFSARTGTGSCLLTSTYLGGDPAGEVSETLTNDGEPRTWRRSTDGTTWETNPTDTVRIRCDDAHAARAFAVSASFIPA